MDPASASTVVRPRDLAALLYAVCASALFPASILALLAITDAVALPIPRYDAMLVGCLAVQAAMLAAGVESRDEAKVILLFHALGLAMEVFKVHAGSWSYPDEGVLRVGGVPLYSGFMYASVASFLAQLWRRLDIRLHGWPDARRGIVLGAAIYLNFFWNRWGIDVRWGLAAITAVLLWRVRLAFALAPGRRPAVPLLALLALLGGLVWGAEQVATLMGAWAYPDQLGGWRPVGGAKLSSWMLLGIVSFVIVAELKRVKGDLEAD